MNRLLALTAALEAVTGLALMIAPAVVVRLLMGEEVSGGGAAVARVAGIALLALGFACWPLRKASYGSTSAPLAMLVYNSLITSYLIFLGIGSESVGILLWPVVIVHGVLTLLLIGAWFKPEHKQNAQD